MEEFKAQNCPALVKSNDSDLKRCLETASHINANK